MSAHNILWERVRERERGGRHADRQTERRELLYGGTLF